MTHIAITEALDGISAEWMEQVSEAQYGVPTPVAAPALAPPPQGQKLFGDIAPKFAQLTDDVHSSATSGRAQAYLHATAAASR